MLKKFSIPIILFLVGICFYIIGALFKILHWGLGFLSAPNLLILASFIQLVAITIAIVKLLQLYNGKR